MEWGLPLWSPIFSSTVTVVTSVSLLLGLKFWPEMKTKEKRVKATTKQQQNQNQKQTKANISKKLHGIWEHKSGANFLIRLIRLTEVFRRHA